MKKLTTPEQFAPNTPNKPTTKVVYVMTRINGQIKEKYLQQHFSGVQNPFKKHAPIPQSTDTAELHNLLLNNVPDPEVPISSPCVAMPTFNPLDGTFDTPTNSSELKNQQTVRYEEFLRLNQEQPEQSFSTEFIKAIYNRFIKKNTNLTE